MSQERAAHTPGPWTYFVGNADGRGLIRIEQLDTGVHIASMQRGAVSEANARLIAAAPDLLAALTNWRAYAMSPGKGSSKGLLDVLRAADAAIAKAKGGA